MWTAAWNENLIVSESRNSEDLVETNVGMENYELSLSGIFGMIHHKAKMRIGLRKISQFLTFKVECIPLYSKEAFMKTSICHKSHVVCILTVVAKALMVDLATIIDIGT